MQPVCSVSRDGCCWAAIVGISFPPSTFRYLQPVCNDAVLEQEGQGGAVEPDEKSSRVSGQVLPPAGDEFERQLWYRQHGTQLPDSYRVQYKERWEAEFERRRVVANNVKELDGKCTPEFNAAEEAAIEALLIFQLSAWVRGQLAEDVNMLHKDCCHRKGGTDKRVGEAVRTLHDWSGKEALDDFVSDDGGPPAYAETAPAYTDAAGVQADQEKKES